MNGIPSTPEIFAFVQARTGSTRLRGKIFRHIPEGSDTTLLDHIAKRLGRILPADRVIFLVPENDIEAIEFCKSRKYNWFEGPEEDVRERYILAAKAHNAETIIRLTGDNPFIDILHAELLIESFFNTDVDIASFYGLPIGMGLEIFKRSSLLTEPETGLEARHREHVSLHLKENPEKFRFLKLKPVLTETEILGSEKIRLTIDEIKDFYLAETIFQELGTKNFFFGAKEVISLLGKNSGIFSLNEDVKQIAYPLKNTGSEIKNRIFIQYANPEQSGTGHFERCKILFVKLQAYDFEVTMSDSFDGFSNYDLYIIDNRDQPVPAAIRNENILLIDNFGTDRNAFPHHDVLPNPETDFLETLENTLLPSLIDLYAQEKDEKIVTIYSGNLTPEYTRVIDKIIAENFGKNFRLIRIGNADSDQEIEVRNRVFRKEYFELLGKSEFFISYFGQSVMEALYMQKKIVLFSISDYHEKLAEFLSEKTGIFHIGNILNAKLQCKIDPEKIKKPEIIIRNRGFTILLEKIRNLCL